MVRVWSCPWSCDASESASHAWHGAEPPGVHRSPSAGGGLRTHLGRCLEPESIGHCWERQDCPHLRLGSGPGARGETRGEVPCGIPKKTYLLKHQELEGVGSCHFHRYSSCHLDWSNGVVSLWLWFQTWFNVFLVAIGNVFHFCAFGAPPVDWCVFWFLMTIALWLYWSCQRLSENWCCFTCFTTCPFCESPGLCRPENHPWWLPGPFLGVECPSPGSGGQWQKGEGLWQLEGLGEPDTPKLRWAHSFFAGKLGLSEFGVCSKVCLGCKLFDVEVWSSFLALRLARMVILSFALLPKFPVCFSRPIYFQRLYLTSFVTSRISGFL